MPDVANLSLTNSKPTESLFHPSPRATAPRPREVEPAGIQAVETRYAGCRFRSRTEAKWAVAFDELGIEWIYEPETYRVGPFGARRGYLPDFYLPRQAAWVEVKGHAAAVDGELLLAAADPVYGLPLSFTGDVVGYGLAKLRMLVLGPVPSTPYPHDALLVLGGEVVAQTAAVPVPTNSGAVFTPIGFPVPASPDHVADAMKSERRLPSFTPREVICAAYRAARMARFEHGESGAPQRPEPVPVSPNPVPVSVASGNTLTRFVETRCLRGSDRRVPAAEFRDAYVAWCDAEHVTAVGTKDFTRELRRLGAVLSRGQRPRLYYGVSLREVREAPAQCSRCAAGELHDLGPRCDRPENRVLDGMNPPSKASATRR